MDKATEVAASGKEEVLRVKEELLNMAQVLEE